MYICTYIYKYLFKLISRQKVICTYMYTYNIYIIIIQQLRMYVITTWQQLLTNFIIAHALWFLHKVFMMHKLLYVCTGCYGYYAKYNYKNSLPGYDSITNSSKSWLPFNVDIPMSMRPVVATSNIQKVSSPQVSIACCSNAVSEKVGSNTGSKFGS